MLHFSWPWTIESSSNRGEKGSSNLHERARERGTRERVALGLVGTVGRGGGEGKKDGIAEAGENGDERTGRNKTVISRHFTHERERLADSTCVPALRRFPAAVKRPSRFPSSLMALSFSPDFALARSSARSLPFSLLLHHLHPHRGLAEKYYSR